MFTILGKIDKFARYSSIGGIIAAGIDWIDGHYDGKISVNKKLWWFKMIDAILFISIIIFYALALTLFRLSPKQIIQLITYFGVCCIIIGVYSGFSSVLSLLCMDAIVMVVVTLIIYYSSMKKEGFKFDEPLFEKGAFKEIFILVKKFFKWFLCIMQRATFKGI